MIREWNIPSPTDCGLDPQGVKSWCHSHTFYNGAFWSYVFRSSLGGAVNKAKMRKSTFQHISTLFTIEIVNGLGWIGKSATVSTTTFLCHESHDFRTSEPSACVSKFWKLSRAPSCTFAMFWSRAAGCCWWIVYLLHPTTKVYPKKINKTLYHYFSGISL